MLEGPKENPIDSFADDLKGLGNYLGNYSKYKGFIAITLVIIAIAVAYLAINTYISATATPEYYLAMAGTYCNTSDECIRLRKNGIYDIVQDGAWPRGNGHWTMNGNMITLIDVKNYTSNLLVRGNQLYNTATETLYTKEVK